ncbi:MAG: putative Zn-ribbon and HTH transcriptional regulator [Methanobacteriota archaeon]|jgi:predicted Zn-ribbon and HTH transcriptional regulator|uniref:Transcriptional regulator n=1 Tax=Halorutilus salinus TaxID=2487751 RepID=A0A9Q4GFD1_9EURY|nr:transcriptional regulator [Halorutilus salinus]MCX2818029.1 transcriptional regulator [Halorutilus salinus]
MSNGDSEGVDEETTRRRIADHLRDEDATPSELAEALDLHLRSVYASLSHVSRSVEAGDERLLVVPPECSNCGFSGFDDPLGRPSRCPSCKSERIEEPVLRLD